MTKENKTFEIKNYSQLSVKAYQSGALAPLVIGHYIDAANAEIQRQHKLRELTEKKYALDVEHLRNAIKDHLFHIAKLKDEIERLRAENREIRESNIGASDYYATREKSRETESLLRQAKKALSDE